ncbi:hypothetical protein [uncultured Ruminococcus sp.]|uniref:hypothetical protein n=1 Tax=uncultured Ruminococcus sp. TaxID=165186 RepID=UPI0025DF999D|nr:hypothetical protein [uncultured Ruminococcus sp.]
MKLQHYFGSAFLFAFCAWKFCCTLFLNFWVAYIAALLKAGADYGSAHELSKAHNIFQYYILYLTQTAALFAGLNTTALVKSICGLCQYLQPLKMLTKLL